MFMIVLATLLGSQPTAMQACLSAGQFSFAQNAMSDPQPAAIRAITSQSATASRPIASSPQDRSLTDPQAEIINRITGRNLQHPSVSQQPDKSVDLQSRIVRSIRGRD
ncbi:hypothetical protein [Sphingobium sp. D43FB]|uniref:hypothetical protein n=1 Tax=Sphingobium sp. D43FB TaxID=2017595 RepID=UPI000BB585C9|nr:hypothetical protein [Sphingobium sp. D43FB]PBN42015.1 hypothetical protein SxD43FB_18435 [Sphingobium sp. D43FB]